jgi:hypothetical protein
VHPSMPKEKWSTLCWLLMTLLTLCQKNTETTKGYEGFFMYIT